MTEENDPKEKFIDHLRTAEAALELFESGELPLLKKFVFGSRLSNAGIGVVSITQKDGAPQIEIELNKKLNITDIEILKAFVGTATALIYTAIGLDMRFFMPVDDSKRHPTIE